MWRDSTQCRTNVDTIKIGLNTEYSQIFFDEDSYVKKKALEGRII